MKLNPALNTQSHFIFRNYAFTRHAIQDQFSLDLHPSYITTQIVNIKLTGFLCSGTTINASFWHLPSVPKYFFTFFNINILL